MTDMREKIAKAFLKSDMKASLLPLPKESRMRLAQVALQALMEPTDAMIEAMAACFDPTWGYPDTDIAKIWAKEGFKAAIKEAMKEGK